jgi:cytoskeleton protein RodZ
MSPAQAAEEMRLTTTAVLAMEEGRYHDLGPPVFARGHLRRYASLVGVPAEDLLAAYDSAVSNVGQPDLIPPASLHTPMRSPRVPLRPWQVWVVAAAALAVVGAVGWWYWRARGQSDAPAAAEAAATRPAPPADQSAPPADADAVAPAAPGQEDAVIGPSRQQVAGGAATRPGLTLSFSGPCWLEVYDAAGGRLAFELADAGAVRSFRGPAPWRVVLGNVRAVRVSIDGNAVAIPASLVVRDAALVSISGRGEVAQAPAAAAQDS